MEDLPIILTVGIRNYEAEDVIKLILGKKHISGTVVNENVTAYTWNIDNKYYSADVYLFTLNSKDSCIENFERVDAILLYGDCNSSNCVGELNDWITYLKNIRPVVKILLSNNPAQEESRKDAVLQWCIENEFEVVELTPKLEDEDATIEFAESIGIQRVIEILHTHQWPNLTLKEKIILPSVNYSDFDDVYERSKSYEKASVTKLKGSDIDPNDSSMLDNSMEQAFENIDQLSMLFNNLNFIKRGITSLNGQDRLNQAEEVVKAFWNAINGDSDEFSEDENV